MSDKELIEKIEDAYSRVRKIGPDAIYETELREVLRAAADALSARQPSEDDREALVRVVANHPIAPLMRLGGDAGYPLADAILAAGFSRAAVPDAATAAEVFRDMGIKHKAERDAALAAIERVRAIHYPFTPQLCYMNAQGGQSPMTSVHCHHCKPEGSNMVGDPDTWPCPTVAALDGAPEPEWEYRVRDADCGTTYVVARPKDSAISSGRYLRRRKAGPWEPVERERERSHEQTT